MHGGGDCSRQGSGGKEGGRFRPGHAVCLKTTLSNSFPVQECFLLSAGVFILQKLYLSYLFKFNTVPLFFPTMGAPVLGHHLGFGGEHFSESLKGFVVRVWEVGEVGERLLYFSGWSVFFKPS